MICLKMLNPLKSYGECKMLSNYKKHDQKIAEGKGIKLRLVYFITRYNRSSFCIYNIKDKFLISFWLSKINPKHN